VAQGVAWAGAVALVAACAAVLGIDPPSDEPADAEPADGDARDEEGADARGDASSRADEGAGDARLDAAESDAGGPEGGGPEVGGPDTQGDASTGGPTPGIPCGVASCSGAGMACCYDALQHPQTCAAPGACADVNYVLCDGDEDCNGVCCAQWDSAQGTFSSACYDLQDCTGRGVRVCHEPSTCGGNGCSVPKNGCLPLSTCGGRCN
jgi:hypothetical protein